MGIILIIAAIYIVISLVFCILEDRSNEENYQSFKRFKKTVYVVFTAVVLVISAINSVYTVNEQQQAFTVTFGVPTMVENHGVNFHLPFITKVYKVDTTTKGIAIGYDIETNESIPEESLMITSDFNLVNVDTFVEFRVVDPIEYVFGSNDPEGILKNIAQASNRNVIGLSDVDSVITTGKAQIEASISDSIIEKLGEYETGLAIVNVTIQDSEPPTEEVSQAFKAVETAKQNSETIVNGAKEQESKQIPEAKGEADQIIKEAEATKTERINQAIQEVAVFKALYEQYMQNPETVKKQLYYEVMEEILPRMKIIIGDESKVISIQNDQE